jgi:hypothetical protein
MTQILVPDNVNPYDKKELWFFIESLGLSLMEDYEEVFQYLDEFTQGRHIDMGMKVFLTVNTYDRHPGKRFVVGYNVDYVKSDKLVKSYIVEEYKVF